MKIVYTMQYNKYYLFAQIYFIFIFWVQLIELLQLNHCLMFHYIYDLSDYIPNELGYLVDFHIRQRAYFDQRFWGF